MTFGDVIRFNNICNPCRQMFSTLVTVTKSPSKPWVYKSMDGTVYDDHNYKLLYTCRCGMKRLAKSVIGKYNSKKKCNQKCQAATGHNCECSCAGKNHGAAFS